MSRATASRYLAATVALGLLAGCIGRSQAPAPNSASTKAAAPAPTAKPSASPIPINVTAHAVGTRYVYLTKQKRNRKVYVLRADAEKGHYFGQDTGVSNFVNPHITFFARDGKQLIADAPLGTVVEKDKTVRMSGGVRARSLDGLQLACDSLRYDDETESVHGEGNVDVKSAQGEELRGDVLDWNLRDGRIDVSRAR